eukprot:jgi/Mesvir1/27706/Mv07414-RA.1
MFKMETLARCRINARPCARMSSRQSTTTQRSFAREGCGQRAPDSYLCRDRVSACMRLSAPSSNLSTSLSESTATFSHRVRELELRSRKPRRLVTFGAQFRDKVAREDDSGDSQSESSSDEEEDDESELGDDETERGAPFSLSKSAGVRGEYDYGDDEDEEEDDLDDDDLDVIEIDDGELLEVDVSQLGLFGTESRVQAVRWTNEAAASRVAGGETAGEDSKCCEYRGGPRAGGQRRQGSGPAGAERGAARLLDAFLCAGDGVLAPAARGRRREDAPDVAREARPHGHQRRGQQPAAGQLDPAGLW